MASRGKGAPFPQDIMLTGGRWELAYPLSARPGAARLEERGGPVDPATLQRGVVHDRPPLDEACHRRPRAGWVSGRREETARQGKGVGRDLSRAVATQGPPLDLLRTEQREEEAARRGLKPAIRRHGVPEKRTIDGSAAHEAALHRDNTAHGPAMALRQSTDRNQMVDQEHRAVKRVTRPLLGLHACEAAPATLAGSALMPLSKKRHLVVEEGDEGLPATAQFYALAASSPHRPGQLTSHRLHTKICDRT